MAQYGTHKRLFEMNAILLDPSYQVNKSLKNVDTEPISRMFTDNVFYLLFFIFACDTISSCSDNVMQLCYGYIEALTTIG